jgi:pimeloyl-ACP methyl ester carboxylesterase
VRESGLDEPVLIGHSMNAATVARTAVRHPALPRGVVLEDPDGLHDVPDDDPDQRVARIRDEVEQSDGQSVDDTIAEYYRDFDPVQARRLATASSNLRPEAAEMVRNGYPSPLNEIFPDITCRTLILRSDGDVETRVMDLEAADSLPNGRLVHVPDAGHYVFHDQYDAAYAELQTFLRRV